MSATDEQKVRHEFDVRFVLEGYDDLAAATDALDQLLRTMKGEADKSYSSALRGNKIQQPRITSAIEMPVYGDDHGEEVYDAWEL